MLWKSLITLINLIISALGGIGGLLFGILPNSPFKNLSFTVPYLAEINWVIPFNFIITVLSVWLPAIAVFYGVSIALRWIKAIE